jgi:RHS repeat-associated protein
VDPLSGRTVVTNVRLPGQYDERLLGSLGLQGPYYNWNRWYLPGVGRYLELDPPNLKGFLDPQGRSLTPAPDWYGYARQNPLRYTDSTGLSPNLPPAANDPNYLDPWQCQQLGCPASVTCEGNTCLLKSCVKGRCSLCTGDSNLVVVAGCTYECKGPGNCPAGAATVIVTHWGAFPPICLK